jgi:DNA-3-methyladenine glycosylase II
VKAVRTAATSKAALDHLRMDPVMAGVIERVGPIEYSVDPDLWRGLVGSIVGQQLSVLAARTIRGRIEALGGDAGFPTPELIASLPEETLRSCGLSGAKTRYVRDVARVCLTGELEDDRLERLDDEAVIEALVRIKGVGRWTAEMVLIFTLDRPDVLAVDDLGIRVAVQRAYGLGDRPGREELTRIGEPWRPFRSLASRYLWRSLTE